MKLIISISKKIAENFSCNELINLIKSKYDFEIILLGGKSDKNICNEILEKTNNFTQDFSGETSILKTTDNYTSEEKIEIIPPENIAVILAIGSDTYYYASDTNSYKLIDYLK